MASKNIYLRLPDDLREVLEADLAKRQKAAGGVKITLHALVISLLRQVTGLAN